MNNHRDVTDRILRRRDEAVAAQHKTVFRRVTVGAIAAVACLALVVGVVLTQNSSFSTPISVADGSGKNATASTTEKGTASKADGGTASNADGNTATLPELPDNNTDGVSDGLVVWDESGNKSTSGAYLLYAELGTTRIYDRLEAMAKENSKGTVFAVKVEFYSCVSEDERNNFVYDGTTLKALTKRMDELIAQGVVTGKVPVTDANGTRTQDVITYPADVEEEMQAVTTKINALNTAFYNQKAASFADTFEKNGLTLYRDPNSSVNPGPFAYTFATIEQLRAFTCKANEAFCFAPAVQLKLNETYNA